MRKIFIITILIIFIGCEKENLNFDNDKVIVWVENTPEDILAENQGLKYTYVIGSYSGEEDCFCVGAANYGIGTTGDYLEVIAESKIDCHVTIQIKDEQGNVYLEKRGYKKVKLITQVP